MIVVLGRVERGATGDFLSCLKDLKEVLPVTCGARKLDVLAAFVNIPEAGFTSVSVP